MRKTIGIGLFVAIVGVSGTLYATDFTDCSKLEKYVDGKTYHQGDVVWYTFGGGEHPAPYRCTRVLCATNPHMGGWDKTGECKLGTP